MRTAAKKTTALSTRNLRARTGFMTRLALLTAIIFVMAFSPLGYLRTPGLTITFLTVPVTVGAVLLGPTGGAACGLAFGLTSLITAFTGGSPFTAMLLSIDPPALIFTSLIPRVLEGWLTGLIFLALKKRFRRAAYLAASLACPILNTLLFMSSLVFFFYRTDYIQGFVNALGAKNPLMFAALFVGVQGVIEAGVCAVIGSAVSRSLAVALKRG